MVLISSNDDDQSTNEVIRWLNYYNVEWVRINGFDSCELEALTFTNNELSDFRLKVNGVIVDLLKVNSYWYRRGGISIKIKDEKFSIDPTLNFAIKNYLKAEMEDIEFFLHKFLESKISINSYLTATNKKTYYSYKAVKCGLNIPKTIISNKFSVISDFIIEQKRVVSKPINEMFHLKFGNENYHSETTNIEIGNLNEFSETCFPTLFQSNIEKFADLRIFYIDSELYPMAIFSQQNEKTKLDFRNYDTERPNRCVPFILPDETAKNLDKFMKSIAMDCGSIDMILTPEGKYIFLEVNPVGQFGMVSYPCNYNIEQKLAKKLGKFK